MIRNNLIRNKLVLRNNLGWPKSPLSPSSTVILKSSINFLLFKTSLRILVDFECKLIWDLKKTKESILRVLRICLNKKDDLDTYRNYLFNKKGIFKKYIKYIFSFIKIYLPPAIKMAWKCDLSIFNIYTIFLRE